MQSVTYSESDSQSHIVRPKSIAQNGNFGKDKKSFLEPNLTLSGSGLKVRDIDLFLNNPQMSIRCDEQSMKNVERARNFLQEEISKRIIYGVNTGFGPMASHIISPNELTNLQYNLIRSHAVGMGKPIGKRYVLAAMIIRLNTLLRGYSGVSKELIDHFQTLINHRIIPIVPEHGAVGTSGDLVQLAHIALALIGEGNVVYKNKRYPTQQVFKDLGIKPYQLKVKEGLALINGTSAMSGIAALNCLHAHRLLSLAIRTGAFSLELVHGHKDAIAEKLQEVRPHPGQIAIAKKLRETLDSSRMLSDRASLEPVQIPKDVREISEVVQEIYSFRCIPQILGPVYDTLRKTQGEVQTEINSTSDNPIIDVDGQTFLHGGNFHGDYISLAMDQLKITMAKMTMLSERRINFFFHKNLNNFFPPFLNLDTPGLTLGLQGLQFVATSTTSQSQTLSFPQYVHSIPTNGDNQDVVSMGVESALFAAKVIENAYIVLAIEVIALAQATDYRNTYDKLSNSSKHLYDGVRQVFPKITNDRAITDELPNVVTFLKSNQNLNLYLDLSE